LKSLRFVFTIPKLFNTPSALPSPLPYDSLNRLLRSTLTSMWLHYCLPRRLLLRKLLGSQRAASARHKQTRRDRYHSPHRCPVRVRICIIGMLVKLSHRQSHQ
jgi:hypothetical protein